MGLTKDPSDAEIERLRPIDGFIYIRSDIREVLEDAHRNSKRGRLSTEYLWA